MWQRTPWPVTLREDAWDQPPFASLVLRPLARADERVWSMLRAANAGWLAPWEASDPAFDRAWLDGRPDAGQSLPPGPALTFREYVAELRRQGRQGRAMPFAITVDDELVGQLTVSGITYGSQRSASIGYWVSQHVAGRGIAPTAVAMVADYCFDVRALHRIEICIRPENAASLRVPAKLGWRDEGLRPRFIHIGGRWADHRVFAVDTSEAAGEGAMMRRWRDR